MNKPPRRAASGVAMMKLGAVQCSVCYETFRSPGDFALATERCEHPLTGLTCADCLSMFISTHIATQGLEFPYCDECGEEMTLDDVERVGGAELRTRLAERISTSVGPAARLAAAIEGYHLCPKCRVPVMKVDGCNHVRCGLCRTEFDWEYDGIDVFTEIEPKVWGEAEEAAARERHDTGDY